MQVNNRVETSRHVATRVNERSQPPENRSLVPELSFNVDEQIRVLFTRISNAVYAYTCSCDVDNKYLHFYLYQSYIQLVFCIVPEIKNL